MTDLDLNRKPSRRLWLVAAIGAIALHAGGVALALAHLSNEAGDDGSPSQEFEVGVELTEDTPQDLDLPPGPEADASAASPALNEQKAEVKDSDLPKDTPQQTEQADRVVTSETPKKVDEEQQEKAVQQQQASTESVAAEATVRKRKKTKLQQRIVADWQKELVAYLDKHKRYPNGAMQKNLKIVVSFQLDRLGHVVSTRIVEGSGDPAFDEAALDMVKRSDPVPAPPPLIADEGLTFSLPVIFRVKGKG
jgi:periplasmic protein TonB